MIYFFTWLVNIQYHKSLKLNCDFLPFSDSPFLIPFRFLSFIFKIFLTMGLWVISLEKIFPELKPFFSQTFKAITSLYSNTQCCRQDGILFFLNSRQSLFLLSFAKKPKKQKTSLWYYTDSIGQFGEKCLLSAINSKPFKPSMWCIYLFSFL